MNSEQRSGLTPLEMSAEEFKKAGHELVDQIAEFLNTFDKRPVTKGKLPSEVRQLIGDGSLPIKGNPNVQALLNQSAQLLFENSLFNGHPMFFGYITSSPTPIGILSDMLASAVNPNVGAGILSPVATEIESQTIRWMAEFIGYPSDCGGVMVSGGNMANFLGFLAARRAKANWIIREEGINNKQMLIYASEENHTWIHKAADLFGHGLKSIRWIKPLENREMDVAALEKKITEDIQAGHYPFCVVGNAGTVSLGVVDPLDKIAGICKKHNLWFHVDGAYGAPAAGLTNASSSLKALSMADSVAIDPHKWFYSPIEAGCTLVRNKQYLIDAFSFNPAYYNFKGEGTENPINFYEFGMQNTRGFKALKVWMAFKQIGREGFQHLIQQDIDLAKMLYDEVTATSTLEAYMQSLSITTFRYVPSDINRNDPEQQAYLNDLNQKVLNRLQREGEAFVSNALINGKFLLRACIVNFRTRPEHMKLLPTIVVRVGNDLHRKK
jgi:glutamate/tyrosine decarboxylase-like PLP-dependent enzyme